MLASVHERDGYPTYWPADPEGFVFGIGTLAAWVAVRGGEIVGHVALATPDAEHAWAPWREATRVPASGLGVIARFYVAPRARGTGVAGALFTTAEHEARARGLAPVLDVADHNRAGIAFYERRGWCRVGTATLTLRDPEGATLAMLLYVAPGSPRPALDIAALEEVAARAVPAAETARIGGWVARCTPEVGTRRANSVLAAGDDDSPLDARIEAAESFYARRGRPACFQITPASRPAGLADRLRRRGYVPESPTLVQVGACADAAAGIDAVGVDAVVASVRGPTWLATWSEALGVAPERSAGPIALWGRIPAAVAYVTVCIDDAPVGVGMAVRDGGFVGVFNMATLPRVRRRGVARAALRALAMWGARGGAERVYLQVDVANDGARALYANAGLVTAYEYSYLRRELTDGA